MGRQQPIELFMPPNMLKAKAGGGLGGMDMAALKRADQAMETLQGEFAGMIADDVKNLVAARAKFAAAPDAVTRSALLRAAFDIKPDLWFFGCHFKNDPVMPGCLGLDAMWQMVGFYLGWIGGEGRGRALGLGELKFSGQVLPNAHKVTYNIDIKRVMRGKLVLGIADGWLSMDDEIIYRAKDLRVGLFKQGAQPGA